MPKEHKEFHAVDMGSAGWRSPPGYPEDIEQKILAGGLDEKNKTGNRTRLLRFRPGAFTTEPFVHDYWEEVYLISGDLVVGDGKNGEAAQSFRPNTYACRPPGISHGPFRSGTGCVLLEFHYYEESAR
jgi:hypothetical protein